MNRLSLKFFCFILIISTLILFPAGCGKKTVTFTGEIETVAESSIMVTTINFEDFDKASVDLRDAKYDFKPSEGQIVEVTILPEIRESYPVQVTAVSMKLKKEAQLKVSDYFPIEDNVRYVYEGSGNEFAGFSAYTDYTSPGKVQQQIDNGGTSLVRVFQIKGGKLIRTLSKGEVYYRENFLNNEEINEVLLMEPLKKGTSWTLADGTERTITDISAEVGTPMGTYSAIEVTTENDDGTNIDYYAKKVGLVKTVYRSGSMEVSSVLKSIEKNAERIQSVNFYYPDVQADKIYYLSKDVAFRTNDSTAQVMETAYRDAVNQTYGVVLSTNAAIKSLALDEDNKVRIDMNKSFASDMNAGSGYEGMILQCIANTFGQYYSSGEVILTVEGKPYESGHFLFKEGESIPVKLNGIKEKS